MMSSKIFSQNSSHKDVSQLRQKYYPHHGGPQDDFIYAFLSIIKDGTNDFQDIKNKMRKLFISIMRQHYIRDENIDDYLKICLEKKYVFEANNEIINLTKKGELYLEDCKTILDHSSYWFQKLLSENSVVLITAISLIFLSFIKIIFGLAAASHGMFSEGLENLTDLIKIPIILVIGIKLKKDKLGSILIIFLMIFAGVMMIYTSIDALMNLAPIDVTSEIIMITLISIAINSGLSYYKSLVGRSTGNMSLLMDSKDSEFNVLISLGVLIGLLSAIFKLYFVDAIVAIIIALFVIKEAIEILIEITSKKENFDILNLNVKADRIYKNLLAKHFLAKIKEQKLECDELIGDFCEGLELGRKYFQVWADFNYSLLGAQIARKHLDTLIQQELLLLNNEKLILSEKGHEYLKRIRHQERFTHVDYYLKSKKNRKLDLIKYNLPENKLFNFFKWILVILSFFFVGFIFWLLYFFINLGLNWLLMLVIW